MQNHSGRSQRHKRFQLGMLGIILPMLLEASTVNVSWNANSEQDLAGYKIYYGTQRGVYSVIVDVGKVLSYDVANLTDGSTYYFAVTAYDLSGNESGYSQEVSFTVVDSEKPSITNAVCDLIDRIRVVFSESVQKTSAELAANYVISGGIVVQKAELQTDGKTVFLYTTQHVANGTFTLTVNNVRDNAAVPNTIAANTRMVYTWSGADDSAPVIQQVRLYPNELNDFLILTFNEALNQQTALNSANYTIAPPVDILNMGIDDALKTIYITTACHVPGTYSMTVNGVQDGMGNTIAPNSVVTYVCASQDTMAPVLVAARILGLTQLQLEFSETLDKASAEKISNYSIDPVLAVQKAVLAADLKHVTLTTAAHSAGSYVVTVAGVLDVAVPPNTMPSSQLGYEYVPPDNTPPALFGVALSSDDLVQVSFSEPVDRTTAETKSNYTITPDIEILAAHLNVSESMVLLETTRHSKGTYRISVKNIKDQALPANTMASNTFKDYQYDPPDDIPPQLLKAELHGADVLVLDFSEALDRASVENLSHYQITPAVSIEAASLIGEGLNRVYLETANHQQGQSYEIQVHGIMDRAAVPNMVVTGSKAAYTYPLVDTEPPRLVAVELQGDKTLKLVFSEAMDQTSAETVANYLISPSLTVESATLDASLTQVFLKTGTHKINTTYTVTVQNLKDRANPSNMIGLENQKFYVCAKRDDISPQLLSVDLHGSTTLELCFSEPVSETTALQKSNYAIDLGIQVLNISMSRTQEQVFLQTTPHQKGTYTVTVNGIQDRAEVPNTILPDTRYTYLYSPADNNAPLLVEVTLLSPTMVSLLFNEAMDRASVENTANYIISKSVQVTRAILDVDMTGVLLQTSAHEPGSYSITINGVTDGSPAKNPIASNTVMTYVYEVEDNISPAIVSAVLQDEKRLVITFSESLESSSAHSSANYAINPNIQILGVYASPSEGRVTLETSSHAAGEYMLTVNGIKDASSKQNPIAAYSQMKYTWSPADTVAPAIEAASLMTNNYVQIRFSEPLDAVSANNKANYSISPSVLIQSARLDADLVTVGLITAPHEPGNYTIAVQNLRDKAFVPNVMKKVQQVYYQYVPPDNEAPKLLSVNVRTPMSLALVFDEDLSRSTAENPANYSIAPGIQVTEASLLASLKEVRLETTPHQQSVNYTLQVRNLQDRAPIPNSITTPVHAEYSYVPPDTTRPRLVTVKLQSYNLLELYFSEAVEQISAENRNNYTIEYGVEVLHVSLDTTKLTKVILETTDHMPGFQYQIQVKNIRDRAPTPNTIASNTWFTYSMPASGGLSDNTPPQVAYVDVISSVKMDVVFTEPVDSITAVDKERYSILTKGVAIQSVSVAKGSVRVSLTTSAHEIGKAYEIQVEGIRDCAPFPNELVNSGPVKYMVATGATLSNLNKRNYDWTLLQAGNTAYVDRDYTLTQIPEMLEGAVQIRTANEDKCASGNGFLVFELRGDATLYVAYDKRIAQIPSWLSTWKVTGDQIVNSHSTVYAVYSKEFVGGRVILGGNCGTSDDAMYLLFVSPHSSSISVVSNMNQEAYKVEHLSVGDSYFIDRDYTIASLPEELENVLWIRTANDDKTSRDDDFLTFQLRYRSKVYVGYDSKIASLPRWLMEWNVFEEQIVDSRGTVFDIYYKELPAGDVALGGNCGSSDDNMYIVLIHQLEGGDGIGSDSLVPGIFTLSQNFPNPFNPVTTIPVTVHRAGRVTLAVYNVLGQRVRLLLDLEVQAGFQQSVSWDGTDEFGSRVSSGIYFYRIQQGEYAKTRRMLFLK